MTKPLKYKKKPVVVEALKYVYSTDGINELAKFCGDAVVSVGRDRHPEAIAWAVITTLEDGGLYGSPKSTHTAYEGDYIIKGIAGEFYPVKQDIFAATYELA